MQQQQQQQQQAPMPACFIFRIDEVRENESASPSNTARWMPTMPSARVSGGASGRYWYCNGQSIQQVSQLPSDAKSYSIYSMFYKTGQGFWVYCGDACARPSTEDWQSWQPLCFDHVETYSYLSNAGEHDCAKNVRSDQPWARMLLPSIYHDASRSTSRRGGLIGELAIFLGLLAFSMRPEYMSDLLPQMMSQSRFRTHTNANGRDEKRGVVVYVYTSASWLSTVGGIKGLENGDHGGYYR